MRIVQTGKRDSVYLIVQISCILDSIRIIRRLTVRIVRNILGQGLRVTLALLAFKVLKARKAKRETRVQRVRKDQKVKQALLVLGVIQVQQVLLVRRARKEILERLGQMEKVFGLQLRLLQHLEQHILLHLQS